jgi:hypothetical protein
VNQSCGRNLANQPSLAAALAPPCAALPGWLIPQAVFGVYDAGNTLHYGVLIIVISYAATWLLAVPILRMTRRRIHWTPFRVMLLGATLASSPWGLSILWGFGSDVRNRGLAEAVRMASEYEWIPVIWLGACGLFVAIVFVAIQILRQRLFLH